MKLKQFNTKNVHQIRGQVNVSDVPDCEVYDKLFRWKQSTRFQRNFLRHCIGIEVEVECAAGLGTIIGWDMKHDGSLRNEGVEYTTLRGTNLLLLPSYLDNLEAHFEVRKEGGSLWNFSERTSVHVHHNVMHETTQEIHGFILLYLLFETALFKYAGPSRLSSVYCVPIGWQHSPNVDLVTRYIQKWEKYSAINFSRLEDLGTVEFRHMAGTADKDRILTWCCMGYLLIEYAMSHSLASIKETIMELKVTSQYDKLSQNIFGEFAALLPLSQQEMDEAVTISKLRFPLK